MERNNPPYNMIRRIFIFGRLVYMLLLLSANAQENLTSLNDMGHAYST